MKRSLTFIIPALFFSSSSQSMERYFLSEEAITNAKTLAESSISCEAFRQDQMQKEKKDRLDYFIIESFNFTYKEQELTFNAAVGCYHDSNWGEVALYPGTVDLKKIAYNSGRFWEFGSTAKYLAHLKFEYKPATQDHAAYFILENISAGCYAENKGYSQACVSYFMNEFITKHSNVEFVFSDARNAICQHFFPRYGLQRGMPEAFKTVKFSRPARVPFYWQRQIAK